MITCFKALFLHCPRILNVLIIPLMPITATFPTLLYICMSCDFPLLCLKKSFPSISFYPILRCIITGRINWKKQSVSYLVICMQLSIKQQSNVFFVGFQWADWDAGWLWLYFWYSIIYMLMIWSLVTRLD